MAATIGQALNLRWRYLQATSRVADQCVAAGRQAGRHAAPQHPPWLCPCRSPCRIHEAVGRDQQQDRPHSMHRLARHGCWLLFGEEAAAAAAGGGGEGWHSEGRRCALRIAFCAVTCSSCPENQPEGEASWSGGCRAPLLRFAVQQRGVCAAGIAEGLVDRLWSTICAQLAEPSILVRKHSCGCADDHTITGITAETLARTGCVQRLNHRVCPLTRAPAPRPAPPRPQSTTHSAHAVPQAP